MKNKFKKDDTVYFPTYVELKFLGWKDNKWTSARLDYGIFHDDYNPRSFLIHETMYNTYGGETVTIDSPFSEYTEGLYYIKEDKHHWSWPLDIIDKQWVNYSRFDLHQSHTCEEGMTPIDGWFICKNCGDNLREIKI